MDLSGPLSCLATLRLSTDVNVTAGGLHSIKHCLTVQWPLWSRRYGLLLVLMCVFVYSILPQHFVFFNVYSFSMSIWHFLFFFFIIPLLCIRIDKIQPSNKLQAAKTIQPLQIMSHLHNWFLSSVALEMFVQRLASNIAKGPFYTLCNFELFQMKVDSREMNVVKSGIGATATHTVMTFIQQDSAKVSVQQQLWTLPWQIMGSLIDIYT